MLNIDRIPEAIADLESQEFPNVRATAKKYGVVRKTLENRWKGKSTSMETCVSNNRQCLTNSQEKAEKALSQIAHRAWMDDFKEKNGRIPSLQEDIFSFMDGLESFTNRFLPRNQRR